MLTTQIIDRFSLRAPLLAAVLAVPLALPFSALAEEAKVAMAAVGSAETQPVAAEAHTESHSQTFAIVNGRRIPTQEYESAFASLVRQKFYHGQLPEKEIVAARDEVKNRLVQRIVLLDEAGRRGIVPDAKQIDETIAGYESRYAASAAWQENRGRLLPGLRQQLEEQSLVFQLERQVKATPDPSEEEVHRFYSDKPELFTEPEKIHLSAILLAVDPSSPATAWEATREEAKAIYKRLEGGADFAETARLHSSAYTETGGDMGYLHRGMLPEAMQERVDGYVQGRINEPLETLQGMAIVRLDGRLAAKKRDFPDVAQRARDLLIRERQDQAWKGLIDKLVATADVSFLHGVTAGSGEGGKK